MFFKLFSGQQDLHFDKEIVSLWHNLVSKMAKKPRVAPKMRKIPMTTKGILESGMLVVTISFLQHILVLLHACPYDSQRIVWWQLQLTSVECWSGRHHGHPLPWIPLPE